MTIMWMMLKYKRSGSGSMSPLGRPRYRWEDNIRMDLWEIE
jgi:hypothetical protein